MVEIIIGVKNLKQLHVGKGLTSSPVINKASGLSSNPVVNKKGGNIKKKKTNSKRIKNTRIKKSKYYIIIYNGRIKSNHSVIK